MRSTTIATVGIFGILVVLILLLPQTTKQQMQATFYQAISPILRTGVSVQQRLGGVGGGLKHLDELERENAQLKLENRQLQATNNLLKNSEAEVNRLNRALGYKERSSFRLVPARIISRDSATWWNSCTIDRGAADSIAADMAVVTETGLVGKVTSVANDVAMVLLLSDESLRVSVTIEGTQEQGIVSGTRASTNYAPDLRIRFLSKTANLKPGLNVFTAGAGGVFPSGVLIGRVKDFTVKELEGVATVKPAVDLAEVQDVFVIIGRK
jgi:rod shape-determining protein MreC